MNISEQANKLIQKVMKDYPHTKLTIGVLHQGKTMFKLFDNSGEIPYESHLYEIASISKVFTTSLFAKYLQEGKMNLNDSIAKYIPELEDERYHPTLRSLATHTSGYPRESFTKGEWIKLLTGYSIASIQRKPLKSDDLYFMNYEKMIRFAKKKQRCLGSLPHPS